MSQQTAPTQTSTVPAPAAAGGVTPEVVSPAPAAPAPTQPLQVETRPAKRSPADIEAEMDATRERLANTVAQLQDAVTPKNLARRGVQRVKAVYVTDDGAIRYDNVAKTAGVVVGTIATVRLLKRIF